MAMASRPVGCFFQRNEVVAEHQLDGNLFEKFVVQLEVGEVDKLAAIAPRHILRPFEIRDRVAGRTDGPAVAAVHEKRFFIRCRHCSYWSYHAVRPCNHS